MPPLKWSSGAIRDLDRLHQFLDTKNPSAAQRARKALLKATKIIEKSPRIGRNVEELPPGSREHIVYFGRSAYRILYRFDGDEVILAATRHAREAGY